MKEWKAKLHDLTAIVPRGVMNFLITAFFMAGAYYLSRLLFQFGVENNSALVYVLAVTFVSWLTTGYFYGILASLFSSFCINYYFMYPYSAFSLSYAGYPVAMLSMTAIAHHHLHPHLPDQAPGPGGGTAGAEHQGPV